MLNINNQETGSSIHSMIGICSSNLKKAVEPEDTKQH